MKLAIFDIDGTLIRENRVESACFLDALRNVFGFRDVDSDWTAYEHVTDSGLVHELSLRRRGRTADAEELGHFREVYSNLLVERLEPGDGGEIPGAAAFLDGLRADPEWRVAIATGNFLRLALHKLRRAGVSGFDLPMATADDAQSRSDLLRLAAHRAQEEYRVSWFDHTVSIGDAPWDLRAARELQLPFVATGDRCGAVSSGTITLSHYLDAEEALLHLSKAVCW